MLRPLELSRVFLPPRGNELVEQMRLVGVGVLDIAGEDLDQLVDGHKVVEAFAVDAALPMVDAAAQLFQIIPNARRIAADDDRAAGVLPRDVRQLVAVRAVVAEIVVKQRFRIERV